MDSLLSIEGLRVDLNTPVGMIYGVRNVSLAIQPGEIHGLVGESGCGKSLTAKSILRINPRETTHYEGKIYYQEEDGSAEDLLRCSEREIRRLRGGQIGMIFQDPAQSLNPLMTVGKQMEEMLQQHRKLSKKQAREEVAFLLEQVGIVPGAERAKQYPFEFSGGMLQRVCIAMAISCSPRLLIADEPTTALDVTMQAQILELLRELRRKMNLAVLLITHNFGVVAELCDCVSVMYAGHIVEHGPVQELFQNPRHPYTRDLIASIPGIQEGEGRLRTIPGSPPDLRRLQKGCPYAQRCAQAEERCTSESIPPFENGRHWTACWKGAAIHE